MIHGGYEPLLSRNQHDPSPILHNPLPISCYFQSYTFVNFFCPRDGDQNPNSPFGVRRLVSAAEPGFACWKKYLILPYQPFF